MSLLKTGICAGKELKMNAVLMMLTMTSYFFIQVPAMRDDRPDLSYEEQGEAERSWAFIAFVSSAAWFVIYLAVQYREGTKGTETESTNMMIEVSNMIQLINEGKFNLMQTMEQFQMELRACAPDEEKGPAAPGALGDSLL